MKVLFPHKSALCRLICADGAASGAFVEALDNEWLFSGAWCQWCQRPILASEDVTIAAYTRPRRPRKLGDNERRPCTGTSLQTKVLLKYRFLKSRWKRLCIFSMLVDLETVRKLGSSLNLWMLSCVACFFRLRILKIARKLKFQVVITLSSLTWVPSDFLL